MVALALLCWSIYLCFSYFDRFRTLLCNFHPASSNFPPSIPLIFRNFPPSINPLLDALKTALFFLPRVCRSATHLFVHFQKYLRTPKQYSSIQQRILAWTNSSHRARRHVWCWVEFHPHHCLRGDSALGRCSCARSGKGTQFHCLKFCLGSAGEPTICSHCYSVPYMKIPANNEVILLGNKLVDHSAVLGAPPVGAAPTTSSF